MHNNLLILPEGGADFQRTLRLAALYSEKVHVFSPTKESTLEALYSAVAKTRIPPDVVNDTVIAHILNADPELKKHVRKQSHAEQQLLFEHIKEGLRRDPPALDFLRVCVANREDLAQLEAHGALTSIIENAFPRTREGAISALAFFRSMGTSINNLATSLQKKIIDLPASLPRAYWTKPTKVSPTICSLFELAVDHVADGLHEEGKLSEEQAANYEVWDMSRILAPIIYFLLSSIYASRTGCVGVTSDGETQAFFDQCSEAITEGEPGHYEMVAKRSRIRNKLGQTILEDQVPDVSRLPLEEILGIRDKRSSELESFRVGLNQLAANIDLNLDDGELLLAIDAKIQTEVRPALRDLQVSIQELQRQAYRNLFDPTGNLSEALVTFGISTAAGVPVQLASGGAAAATLIAKLYDFTIGQHVEKQNVLSSSPWTVLFHLRDS